MIVFTFANTGLKSALHKSFHLKNVLFLFRNKPDRLKIAVYDIFIRGICQQIRKILTQLFKLFSKRQWRFDVREVFDASPRAVNDHPTIAQNSAQNILFHIDAFNFT